MIDYPLFDYAVRQGKGGSGIFCVGVEGGLADTEVQFRQVVAHRTSHVQRRPALLWPRIHRRPAPARAGKQVRLPVRPALRATL